MELIRDAEVVVVDAGPFFRFGDTGLLTDFVAYLDGKTRLSREVERELLRNAENDDYAFLRLLGHLSPPLEVVDLSPQGLEELTDRVSAARNPSDHPDEHKGEIATVLVAVELGQALVLCDDRLGKGLAKQKACPRLSTVQVAAEMVAAGAISHQRGIDVFSVSAGGTAPQHFANAVKQAEAALGA